MSAPLLEVDGLRVAFETPRGLVQAVDGVTFQLERGKTLGVVGESGSGKSVLVKTIMNLLPSTARIEGGIHFGGRDLLSLADDEARHFWGVDAGMVFQDPMTSLNPVRRVGIQLTEALTYHKGIKGKEADQIAIELLTHVGVPDPVRRLRQYPHELSGGLRQRVVIAMALMCEPALLIADEPTTALDVTVQRHILDLLGRLQAERDMAMILITHDLGVAKGRADDIMVMYGGRTMEHATAAQIFDDPQHPYTEALLRTIPRIGLPPHTRLDPIPGRPPDLISLPPGCRFAPRCVLAQPRCVEESPGLEREAGGHAHACFFPVGTEHGEAARAANEAASVTAAGLHLGQEVVT